MHAEVQKSVLVFDLDGTIFEDFLERDKEHIKKSFNNNKVVMLIDNIARFVNSFDIIKNSMMFLKLRLAIYSIFVSKSYSRIMAEYEEWYKNQALLAIISQTENLKYFSNYEIIILSNNLFSKEIELNQESLGINCTLITSLNKYNSLKELTRKSHVKFMIGNNFSDDILPSKILGISNIYLGKSKFVKKFSKYTFSSLKDICESILLEEVK